MTTEAVFQDHDPCRQDLAKEVLAALRSFASADLGDITEAGVFALLEKPPEHKLGDYALPCFRFAKALRQKPADIAAKIAAQLLQSGSPWVESTKIVGAFLNIFVRKTALSSAVLSGVRSGAFFKALHGSVAADAARVMIEYSQPNTHKEFHVGHMRNVALGDCLVRLHRYCGYDVTAVNYPGDEGAHIAKCLWYLQKESLKAPASRRGEWLGGIYSQASQALDAADEPLRKRYEEEISSVLRGIEAKKGPIFELWQETRQWSLEYFYEIYRWLDVKFDHYFFESELSEESQQIVDEYLKSGVFVESEGAVGVDLNAFDLGFMLVRKRDGNTLYATKDLVLARRKFEKFKVKKSIYVVAAEQNLHFRQVFKALELMGFALAKNCHHLSYGLVMLPEGKMSSRQGTGISLVDLRASIETELAVILERYAGEWAKDEILDIKNKLAVGAIKYGMLNTDPVKDVVFSLADWLSFDGNSGPYLMYSYARACSIMRKSGKDVNALSAVTGDLLTDETEQVLIRELYDFNDVVLQATRNFRPSSLTHYLFGLCQSFNRVYSQVSILKAESSELLAARLSMVSAFALVLRRGLELLGIDPPSRM